MGSRTSDFIIICNRDKYDFIFLKHIKSMEKHRIILRMALNQMI